MQRPPQRYSSRRPTLRHIIIGFTRFEMKEKMLRATREKGWVTHKGKPIRHTEDLLKKPYKPEDSGCQYSTTLKEFLTENFISSQTKLHKQRRNKIIYRQSNAERFCHHQACLTRAPEGSTKHGKEQPVPATAKTYQIVKNINKMKNLHQLMGNTAS